jgi:hypothetical protein
MSPLHKLYGYRLVSAKILKSMKDAEEVAVHTTFERSSTGVQSVTLDTNSKKTIGQVMQGRHLRRDRFFQVLQMSHDPVVGHELVQQRLRRTTA